jgi:hypothetical protein
MDAERLALSAAVDGAAWRIVEMRLVADGLPPGDPERDRLLREAAALLRRLRGLALD